MPHKALLTDLRKALCYLNARNWKKAGFHMGYWAKHKLPETPKLKCGTACCAFGVGTALPSWKEAGLKLVTNKRDRDENLFYPSVVQSMKILGLNEEQWRYIFGITAYCAIVNDISPGDVIRHIDDVLKRCV